MTKRKCYAYLTPIRDVLKTFLELPNVYNIIENYINCEKAAGISGKTYYSLFQGKTWKNIAKVYGNKIVIPLHLYFDDFEINNCLSNKLTVINSNRYRYGQCRGERGRTRHKPKKL